jgi:hypothetical protein
MVDSERIPKKWINFFKKRDLIKKVTIFYCLPSDSIFKRFFSSVRIIF